MNNQIRVLIADANEGFTAQLSGFLGENPAFVVAGVANDGEKACLLYTSIAWVYYKYLRSLHVKVGEGEEAVSTGKTALYDSVWALSLIHISLHFCP